MIGKLTGPEVGTAPSVKVALTDSVTVVPTGASTGTATVADKPSADAVTGAFTGSEEVQTGTIPAGNVTTFPFGSNGVVLNVPVAP